ncbi:hypothetical protein CSB20_10655 [bacterium DOLZORAL124_64_63]|nr:MAG: hypothetical protein CSB20_10655 [bacterium DOLZORAL124_64_63]
MFARAVNNDPILKDVLRDVILFQNNCEKGEGVQLARKYGVSGYPTFIMVDPAGEVSSAWIGYPGPEKWAELVRAGDRDRRTIDQKKKAYDKQPTKDLACCLANHASSTYAFADAVKYFRDARKMDPAGAPEYTEDILANMYYGGDESGFTLDQFMAEADHIMADAHSTPKDKISVATLVRGMAADKGQAALAAPYIAQAMTASEGMPELAEARAELAVDHALLVLKDKDKALALKRKALPAGWEEDAGELNNFAWWCYENRVNMKEAKGLALKGADLATIDAEKANILDTAAELTAALGDPAGAVDLMRRCIELNPENDYFNQQLTRFQQEARN